MRKEFYCTKDGDQYAFDVIFNKIKGQRTKHTVTQAEHDLGVPVILVPVTWTTPFSDTNYNCDQNVRIVSAVDPTSVDTVYVNAFTLTPEGVLVSVYLGTLSVGDVIEIHALAIHD